MKISLFPKTKWAKIRFGVILALLISVGAYYRLDRVALYYLSAKEEGDVLFQSLPHGELSDAIEGVTESEWSHCGILIRRDGRWFVAEAIGEVRYTPLHLWVVRGRGSRVESYRVTGVTQPTHEEIARGVDKLLGRPYDFRYAPDDSEIYCSELVYKVFERESGIKVGVWQQLGDLNWKPHEAFIRGMENGRLPLDREMVTPVSLTRSANLARVYPK